LSRRLQRVADQPPNLGIIVGRRVPPGLAETILRIAPGKVLPIAAQFVI
jgi:hypothetical protein